VTLLLHERVTRAADAQTDALAVALGSRTLGYSELETLSNRIANALIESGCRPGDRVALMLPKEPETIAAMLGTLKAGCAYVPIDLASPAPRAGRIVETADVRVVLIHPVASALLDGIVAEGAIAGDVVVGTTADERVEGETFRTVFDAAVVDGLGDRAPVVPRRGDDPAHILFTSGSTGLPKGVLITHDNVAAFLDWALPTFGMDATDRISSHPPLHFDLSTFDVYGALTVGAALHLVDPALNLAPHRLARFIGDAELTHWFSVPSTMTFLASFDAVPKSGWPSLQRVLFCGEVLPTTVLRHWMARLPHATFTNLYGPTEATIASSYHTFTEPPADDTAAIPIGTACAGEELIVLDDKMQPVDTGESGDLYIGGMGLSPGYWRDEAKTHEAFLPDPRDPAHRLYKTGDLARVEEDGLVYFLGRVDSQIKSRGYRIELGEIETALNAVEAIREAAVVAVPSDGFEGTQIGCVFALGHGMQMTSVELRAALAATLPRYMLPTRWLELDQLPKNANGKIDRVRLRDMLADSSPDALTARDVA
jgi:amino acid adenylation domain-containing protein